MSLHTITNMTQSPEQETSLLLSPMTQLYRTGGLISEIYYDSEQPFVLHLLLPFLQQLAEQPRWQLWLAPQKKISRQWLINAGLPEGKIIAMQKSCPTTSIQTMEKALSSGNFSTVLAWLPSIDDKTKQDLQSAAEKGNAYGFIMNPSNHLHIKQSTSLLASSNSIYH